MQPAQHTQSHNELILQTLDLARQFALLQGRKVEPGHRFDQANEDPDKTLWSMACFAQQTLTGANVRLAQDLTSEIVELPVLLAPFCPGCNIRHDGDKCLYRSKRRHR